MDCLEMIGSLLNWCNAVDSSWVYVHILISSSPADPRGRLFRLCKGGYVLKNWEFKREINLGEHTLWSSGDSSE
jgi:hypothetical protein